MLFSVYTEHLLFLELTHSAAFCFTRGAEVAGFLVSCCISAGELQLSTAQAGAVGISQKQRGTEEGVGNEFCPVGTLTFGFTWGQAMVQPRPYTYRSLQGQE